MPKNFPTLLELFLVFSRIGAFTFGGGLAMLSIMKHELCNKRSWMTNDEFLQTMTIGTAFPGLIAANIAFLLGARFHGPAGMVVSVLAVIWPALFIMMLIAAFLVPFFSLGPIPAFFVGAAAAISAQIAVSAVLFFQRLRKDIWGIGVFVTAFFAMAVLGLHPIIVVLASAAVRCLLPMRNGDSKR